MTAQIWDQLAAIGKSVPGAWDELPPLPQGAVYTPALGTVGAAMYTFTADQMRAYGDAVRAEERERCARAFEAEVDTWDEMKKAGFHGAIRRKGAVLPTHHAGGMMDLTDKVAAYANALDSDISAERFEQVRNSELWRGWAGTIYGCIVSTKNGYAFETKAEAIKNALWFREQCMDIRRNTNDERNAL